MLHNEAVVLQQEFDEQFPGLREQEHDSDSESVFSHESDRAVEAPNRRPSSNASVEREGDQNMDRSGNDDQEEPNRHPSGDENVEMEIERRSNSDVSVQSSSYDSSELSSLSSVTDSGDLLSDYSLSDSDENLAEMVEENDNKINDENNNESVEQQEPSYDFPLPTDRDGSEYFDNIPPRVWSNICSHLKLAVVVQLRRVCKTMYNLANTYISEQTELDLTVHPLGDYVARIRRAFHVKDILFRQMFAPPNQWKSLTKISIKAYESDVTAEALHILARNVRTLEDVMIFLHGITNTSFRHFVKANRSLKRVKFHFNHGKLSLASLRCLFRSCKDLNFLVLQLYSLDFKYNGVDFTNMEEKLASMFVKKPNLPFISLRGHLHITNMLDPILQMIFSSSLVTGQFGTLSLVQMPKLRQLIVRELPTEIPENFWDFYPSLHSLIFDSTYCGKQVVDMNIFTLPNCRIADLSLRHCRLTDLSTLRNLNSLDLRDSCNSNEEIVTEMILNNPHITRLSLAGICFTSNEQLRLIGQTCKELSLLDVTENQNLDNASILAFAEGHSEAVNPPTPVLILAASMTFFS